MTALPPPEPRAEDEGPVTEADRLAKEVERLIVIEIVGKIQCGRPEVGGL